MGLVSSGNTCKSSLKVILQLALVSSKSDWAVPCCTALGRAVLCCAVLCRCAVLCCAVPCRAVLCCAVLCCAVLSHASQYDDCDASCDANFFLSSLYATPVPLLAMLYYVVHEGLLQFLFLSHLTFLMLCGTVQMPPLNMLAMLEYAVQWLMCWHAVAHAQQGIQHATTGCSLIQSASRRQ